MFLIDIEEHTDGFRTNRNRLKSTKLKGLKGIVAKKTKTTTCIHEEDAFI